MTVLSLSDRIKSIYGDHKKKGIGRALNAIVSLHNLPRNLANRVMFRPSDQHGVELVYIGDDQVAKLTWLGDFPIIEWTTKGEIRTRYGLPRLKAFSFEAPKKIVLMPIPKNGIHVEISTMDIAEAFYEELVNFIFKMNKSGQVHQQEDDNEIFINYPDLGVYVHASKPDYGRTKYLRIHGVGNNSALIRFLDQINNEFELSGGITDAK